MQTSAERLENNVLEVTVTIDAKTVDGSIADMYKELANKYRFPGFRPGRAPRQVIDNNIGKDSVLAQATEKLVNSSIPAVLETENIVPIGDPNFADVHSMAAGKDFVFKVRYVVRPELSLSSYDPVDIVLPSDEASDEEVAAQLDTFRNYLGKYVDIEGRPVQAGDSVYIKCVGVENLEKLSYENRLYHLGKGQMPEGFDAGLIGMNVADEKVVEFELPQAPAQDGEEAPAPVIAKAEVKINRLVERVLPELSDEFAKNNFGFADLEAMRAAVATEISQQKKQALPQIKENRVTGKLAERLEGEPTPAYTQTVFQELGQNFLMQLSNQGTNLDSWLAANGIGQSDFMENLQRQATDIARESLALDALVRQQGIVATDEEVDEEFKKAGVEDWQASKAEFLADGRLPAIRISICRNKAIDWLLSTAAVTVSDSVVPTDTSAEAAPAAEEKPKAKRTSTRKKTSAAKKAPATEEETPAEAATPAAEEKPAAPKKRTTTRKKTSAAKKAPATEEETPAEAEVPAAEEPVAPKKRTSTRKKAAPKESPAEEKPEQ